MEWALGCVGSWKPSGTVIRWCQVRTDSTYRPYLPQGVQSRAYPCPLTLFNIVVDNVIRTWLTMTVEDKKVAHDGLGETVWQCLRVFYAKYDMVSSHNSDWLHHSMNVLVGLFIRYGLAANIAKSHKMTCHPGALQVGMLEEAMALKCTGVRDSY